MTDTQIGLYCPDVPPTPGGVSDHTLALARALSAQGARVAVFARRGDPALFGDIPCTVGLSPRAAGEAARAQGVGTLLVQYVPFLFARRGVSPSLIAAAAAWRAAKLSWAVYVHEPFVPLTRLPWLITGIPQRFQLSQLLRGAVRAYTSVPRFAEMCRRWAGTDVNISVAPVGATIAPSTLTRDEARARLGLADGQVAIGVFSPAAAGFAKPWLDVAAARLRERPLVRWFVFGHGSDVSTFRRFDDWTFVGPGSPENMADTMRAMDIAAAPYIDGLTLRRTSAMLALASGVPLVSNAGPLYDPSLNELAACERTQAGFADRLAKMVDDPAERQRWVRTEQYRAKASVEALAKIVIRDLGPGTG